MPFRHLLIFNLSFSLFCSGIVWGASGQNSVVPGIEVLLQNKTALMKGKRIGLITNQTGVDRQLRHDVDLLRGLKEVHLTALFSPEHGIRGMAQAGERISHSTEPLSGIPVYSLYGDTQRPSAEMLRGIDLLVYDIQDVGLRFYTYINTLGECMKAASQNKIPFLVLDRPDPLNGLQVEGDILEEAYISAVGPYPLPVRYGMTPGELALWIRDYLKLDLELNVVSMANWQRHQWYDETGLPWVPPSPNLPTPDAALIYAGTCLLEGTNVSEGRGTTKPFEILGAPWVNAVGLADRLNSLELPGVRFRPVGFSPFFSKFKGETCQGVQLHVMDRNSFFPVKTGIEIIESLVQMYPGYFAWQEKHFDRLAGSTGLRENISKGVKVSNAGLEQALSLRKFAANRRKFLIYH
jgi:uncharacterized protein YbbC (DUF1343 family)